jgi:hypothetical protein
MLVPMLSTGSRATEPLDAELTVIDLGVSFIHHPHGIEHSYGHGAGVDPTTAFSRWNPLYSMTACGVVQVIQVVTLYGDPNSVLTVVIGQVQSATAISHTTVCLSQVGYE